jgi:PAS domain-containing protein
MAAAGIQPRALLVATGRSRPTLAAALEAEGFATVVAGDDAEAYRSLADGMPELLVAEVTRETALSREALLVGTLASPLRPPFIVVAAGNAAMLAAALVQRGASGSLRDPVEAGEARAVFRRAHEARRRERERIVLLGDLAAMRDLVHDALLNVQEGILIVDSTGVVQFANDEAARILLQRRSALVSNRLDSTLGLELFSLLKAARNAPDRRAAGEFDVSSGGKRLAVAGRASIVHDHAGKAVGGLLVLRAGASVEASAAAPAAAAAVAPSPGSPGGAAVTPVAPPSSPEAGEASIVPEPGDTSVDPDAGETTVDPRRAAAAASATVRVPRPAPEVPVASASPPPAEPPQQPVGGKVNTILDALRKRTGEFKAKKLDLRDGSKEKP